ncbi:zinc finger protein castor homolog 1 isoform X11 [Danio rerio]|uniref:Zinc finger protein castor homolog 1 isoform X11 n=10 Tax=Danio rerio TaxID=7955 RepID=A0A8M9PL89_DANRE|nr:zinc finger protein castor homolog 1 isoform X6 [Danio rerio]|eukprot:XP_021325669.1 zinc finger protein castor homolog 1 isoform X6 [Danio rerio]
MKVTCLTGFNFDYPEYGTGRERAEAREKIEEEKTTCFAERSLCTEKTSGKSTMAAKRKGGLKLNAICAKLSRQVVYDGSSQNAEGDSDLVDNSERGSLHYDEGDRPESDFPEGLTLTQSLEEDQKRREAIEKWVNGEYGEDPQCLEGVEHRVLKPNNGEDGPPEGVYMVQPKGCSDEEDNAEEADTMPGSHEGSYHEDSEGSPRKDDSFQPTTEAPPRPAPFTPPGDSSALRDYAANTMNEFLNMFGYDDQQVRDELAKKISFEKLKAATSDPSSLSSEEATRRARFSKYEEYIRKLKAGETLPWPVHTKPEVLNSKMTLTPEKSAALIQPTLTAGSEGQIFPPGMDHKQSSLNPAPTNQSHIQNLASRASKYDYFIQKLKMGESLREQNGNSYKRPSKYDLENVKFLHLFKPGEGNPDMGGAIAFKTGKVGRPSKYDIRNIQKLIPGKVDPPVLSSVLPATAGTPGPPVINTAAPAGVVGPPGLPMDQEGHLGFNTDFMKSSFSKTDSITTGTVSSVKNGLPPEKPATEDVNVYQKYIARFSGSQHCGHVHCAYQYREHYHCMDPECNYQRFTSKQDVIRHYNMHKKRDNSLQHGFMRFSPLDDCSVYYHGCHLNGKSTHYHCMQVACNKVYTSTSDVMTHENFHKKNAQLINDGFQRFRAVEDCGTVGCQFYAQKTTHFHCRRPGCTFTFKNKCDIEKHKSYHIKDDAYAKDGFKKFYKYEECKYEGCVYSKATNHFHCIRQGCGFTFTSTSQMTSHKRKHERRHIRSSGVLGLTSSFLLPKEEQDESSNDDLMDYSAISSKNSSLSASPTTQQSSTIPHLLPTPTTTMCSSQSVKPTAALPPASRISTLLSQALPSNVPMALALSNSALAGASNAFFPLIPRMPMPLPPSAAGLISAATSVAHSMPSDSLPQTSTPTGDLAAATVASTPTSFAASSIMEKMSASKGLISPMMARLAAAALKPSGNPDAGMGQAGQFNPVEVKQEPVDGAASQESIQEHSLDLSKKDHSAESNGHPAPGNTSLLSSLMNKMNPGFFNALDLKSELEGAQAADGSDAAQYLSRVMKRSSPEKPTELWKTYLRRYDIDDFCEAHCDFLHKIHFHCLVEDCGALFSTVDGAIKHANFHFRANLKVKSEPPFNESKESNDSGPNQMSAPISMAKTPPVEVPSLAVSGGYSSSPSFQAWKQLAGSIPQLPASMPSMPATSPLATTSLENAKPQVKPGFLQFQDNDPCLATDCKYSNKFHFHCLFGNCKYVCKTSGKAESHCLDHINPNNNLVNVRDQFSYYSLQCLCPNQHCEFRMRGHYHCLRPGCYFVTNITTKLPWHIKKHEKAERRAANGFKYFTKREECGRHGCKYNQVNSHFHCIREGCQFSFLLKHQMTSHARKHMRRMLGKNFDRVPSQVVSHAHQPEEMQRMASLASSGMVGSHHNMNPNFSNMMEDNDDYMDYTAGGSPLGLSSESSNQDRSCTSTPVGNDSSPAGNTISIPTATGAKKRFWIIEDMSPFGKRRKTASSRKMLDEGMMLEGFRRYDLYEDCKDTACQFSLKVTHYHCTRENCGYKFCGRTHMYKHAQHHDRVDNLVLDDFKRFKSSLCCNFPDCQFSGNSTHFHCLRCGFRCTDSTKVTAHRKHHGKQDVISAAGFCQFSSSVDCEVADCKYKLKCSHFHCTYPECKHTVVGMSQMDSHKRKHEKQERGELPSVSPNQDGNHHHHHHHHHHHAGLAIPSMPMNLPPTSPSTPGLTHNNMTMFHLPSTGAVNEYEHPGSAVNLDSSLNLGTDTNSSLFFLKNAAGLGLSDSMDLSKKMHRDPLSLAPGSGPIASMGLGNPQDDTTGTSGDLEDDLSPEEEPIAEDDDDDDDEEEDEAEDDMNTDSYEDSMPEPEVDKDNGESFDASMNHAETSQLDKEDPEAEP